MVTSAIIERQSIINLKKKRKRDRKLLLTKKIEENWQWGKFSPEPQGERYLREPTAVVTLPNKTAISSAIWKLMTCLPGTLTILPVWPGYWHDLGARQNLPNECLCFGQMVMPASWLTDKPRIPALAMISSASVISPHFDKWQLAKCAEISELHSESKTWLSLSLFDPHGVCNISCRVQLNAVADISWRKDAKGCALN